MDTNTTNSIGVALVNNMPMIITALTALVAAVWAVKNKASVASIERVAEAVAVVAVKADTAATQASTAAVKAEELHATSQTIANNTNGHLTELTKEIARLTTTNEGLQKTIDALTLLLTQFVRHNGNQVHT